MTKVLIALCVLFAAPALADDLVIQDRVRGTTKTHKNTVPHVAGVTETIEGTLELGQVRGADGKTTVIDLAAPTQELKGGEKIKVTGKRGKNKRLYPSKIEILQ